MEESKTGVGVGVGCAAHAGLPAEAPVNLDGGGSSRAQGTWVELEQTWSWRQLKLGMQPTAQDSPEDKPMANALARSLLYLIPLGLHVSPSQGSF